MYKNSSNTVNYGKTLQRLQPIAEYYEWWLKNRIRDTVKYIFCWIKKVKILNLRESVIWIGAIFTESKRICRKQILSPLKKWSHWHLFQNLSKTWLFSVVQSMWYHCFNNRCDGVFIANIKNGPRKVCTKTSKKNI